MSVEKTLKKLYSLENKVILLTGAAGGICSVMAQTLAGAGAVLALCDVQEEAVQNLCRSLEGTGHTAYRLDLLDRQDISACVSKALDTYGRIDGLINGAGISKRIGMLDVDDALYERIMDVNLKAAFFM